MVLAFKPWLFGWDTYTNARNVKKIKQNLQTLQEQNNLWGAPNIWTNM